ncbi:hypothetical protein JCM15548_14528 [Geofilum rubicundum JCM 15548]|uniref:ATPase dynein-related AAA domain-containing protein n=2 Tax=Geofilum TaxID=1236988 RepID=A0A0E9LS47_9BACT|nr:hypothetical protein JCM15548_14528 [Geofilum rubicundum JCM 15548]
MNQILFGPPGTGKTYHTIDEALKIIDPDFYDNHSGNRKKLHDRFGELLITNWDAPVGNIAFCTFHQSFSYEDFVEGIKPQTTEAKDIIYNVEPGIFKRICQLSVEKKPSQDGTPQKEDNPNKYVLILDEINRGNVASIFGELITLIEKDKRAGGNEELEITLPYSKETFKVPNNVYLLGTMNTADRSIEALDTALRRRFSFKEMPSRPEIIAEAGNSIDGIVEGIDLPQLLTAINQRVEKLIDKDHMIGHSYFLNVSSLADLKLVFFNKVIPLLQEYFFGDYGKIGLVLGESFVTLKNNDNKFANFRHYDQDILTDLEERKVFEITNLENWEAIDFIRIYQ